MAAAVRGLHKVRLARDAVPMPAGLRLQNPVAAKAVAATPMTRVATVRRAAPVLMGKAVAKKATSRAAHVLPRLVGEKIPARGVGGLQSRAAVVRTTRVAAARPRATTRVHRAPVAPAAVKKVISRAARVRPQPAVVKTRAMATIHARVGASRPSKVVGGPPMSKAVAVRLRATARAGLAPVPVLHVARLRRQGAHHAVSIRLAILARAVVPAVKASTARRLAA
ncbi:hypothetical protein GCM10027296_08990 [Chitinimonas naiadis]